MSTTGTVRAAVSVDERRSRRIWVGLVVGLLGLQVLMCVTAAVLATTDPSHAVVPDYYARGLKWDEVRHAQAASDDLGWKAEWNVVKGSDPMGRATTSLRLVDRDRKPVSGATVAASLFHHARGNEIQQISFVEAGKGTGVYEAKAVMRRGGMWELRISADLGKAKFVHTLAQDWP